MEGEFDAAATVDSREAVDDRLLVRVVPFDRVDRRRTEVAVLHREADLALVGNAVRLLNHVVRDVGGRDLAAARELATARGRGRERVALAVAAIATGRAVRQA